MMIMHDENRSKTAHVKNCAVVFLVSWRKDVDLVRPEVDTRINCQYCKFARLVLKAVDG